MLILTRDEIARMTPSERLELIGELWDSLADGELALPPAQRLELERRLDRFESDRPLAVTWEELKTELARRRP
jgi:putative addiction module component (TIGR02574 family)